MRPAAATLLVVWMAAVVMAAQTPVSAPSRPAAGAGLAPPAAVALVAPPAAPARPGRAARLQEPARGQSTSDGALPELNRYCVTCHNERVRAGGFLIDALDPARVGPDAAAWEKVVRKLRTGMMPPSGAPRPAREVLDGLAAALELRLDQAFDRAAHLQTPSLRRLNRTEYANAIRDLLDFEIDVTPLVPGDGSSEGFDNVADALAASPSLVQGYVSAAMKIARLAIGDRSLVQSTVTYTAPPALAQDRHIDGLPLGTRGGLLVRHTFPLDAEYEFAVGGGPGGGGGLASLDVTVDGEPVALQNPRRFRLRLPAGPHTIGVAILDRQRGAGADEIYSDFRTDAAFTVPGAVQSIAITGPLDPSGVGDTPSRRRILVCAPRSPSDEVPCARRILSTLARRAFRGPVGDAELAALLRFYDEGRRDADFESGIQYALARILVAPRFLYRVEQEPGGLAPGAVYRISDLDLASRLSFFLWSSIPDDELLELAEQNRLRDPVVLGRQVARMLAHPKARALVDNFAGQWLYLRELDHVQTEAKNFDDSLRRSFRRETELLFETIVRENRSLLELLDADFTFVDERLARHYGIAGVRGSHFRRVLLPSDSPRRGLLGQGSMLTVTSVATRTSPVMRGKWILENLLGAPPPQPPPGVETNLDEGPETAKVTTLRQRLELHRGNPVCASCHNIMDPLGFALENFDLVGTWRTEEAGAPIDATGRLADGTPVTGPADLRRALLGRADAFMTAAAEKLLLYAIGRPIAAADMPAVRAIVRRTAAENNRFSAMVMAVVESDVFQYKAIGNRDDRDNGGP